MVWFGLVNYRERIKASIDSTKVLIFSSVVSLFSTKLGKTIKTRAIGKVNKYLMFIF